MNSIKDLNIKKIAVFRALQLGDMLNSIPALQALRRSFPNVEITLISLPWAEAFANRYSALIDAFIAFPGFMGLPEQQFKPDAFTSFLEKIQHCNFDLLIQLHGSGRVTNGMLELFEAKHLTGFFDDKAHIPNKDFFTRYPATGQESERLLALLNFLGIETKSIHTSFPVRPEEKAAAERLLAKNGLEENAFVCIHPGSREEARRWDPGKFAETAEFIAKKGYKVAITGSKSEWGYNEKIRKNAECPAVNLSGQTGLGQLSAVIKKSALLVSNDTGIAHLAAFSDVKSIIIYTKKSSNVERWAPIDREQNSIITPEKAKRVDNVIKEINLKLRERTLQGANKNYEHARAM